MSLLRFSTALGVVLLLLVSSVPTFADDEAAKEKDPLLASWNEHKALTDTYRAKMNEIRRENAAPAGASAQERAEANAKTNRAIAALNGEMEGPLNESKAAFQGLLSKADLAKYASHTEMMEAGLFGLGNDKLAKEPAEAAKWFEAYLKHCPSGRAAAGVRSRLLPNALLGTGDLKATIKRSRELMVDLDDANRPGLQMRIGDFQAASGDTEGAQKTWAEVHAQIDGKTFERNDARASLGRYLNARRNFVGKDAPNIDTKTWIGADAKALKDFKGKVVIIDFWATWCPPCRAAMPGIDEIQKENKSKGVVAIGLTRFYDYGFLPNDSSNLNQGKQFPRGSLTEENFLEHVTEFKKLSGLDYPFAVGTKADFDAYGVSGIPHIVVVDKKGKIALVAIGSGNDALIEACVTSLTK